MPCHSCSLVAHVTQPRPFLAALCLIRRLLRKCIVSWYMRQVDLGAPTTFVVSRKAVRTLCIPMICPFSSIDISSFLHAMMCSINGKCRNSAVRVLTQSLYIAHATQRSTNQLSFNAPPFSLPWDSQGMATCVPPHTHSTVRLLYIANLA